MTSGKIRSFLDVLLVCDERRLLDTNSIVAFHVISQTFVFMVCIYRCLDQAQFYLALLATLGFFLPIVLYYKLHLYCITSVYCCIAHRKVKTGGFFGSMSYHK